MCIGCVGAMCFMESLKRIPISVTAVILNMKGLLVLFFSMIFLDDKVTIKNSLCILLCFFGAILLVKPSLIFPFAPQEKEGNVIFLIKMLESSFMKNEYIFGCILAILTCFVKAGINIWIRRFSKSIFIIN
jgi:drug/metabolite transporter (DMT)-like permease